MALPFHKRNGTNDKTTHRKNPLVFVTFIIFISVLCHVFFVSRCVKLSTRISLSRRTNCSHLH